VGNLLVELVFNVRQDWNGWIEVILILPRLIFSLRIANKQVIAITGRY